MYQSTRIVANAPSQSQSLISPLPHLSIFPLLLFCEQQAQGNPKAQRRAAKTSIVQKAKAQKQVPLFDHLPQYERVSSLSLNIGFSSREWLHIHPAVVRLGLQYEKGVIRGSNARCVAMLVAFKQVISEYQTPPDSVLSRDLEKRLKPLFKFLTDCRAHAISMGNAYRYLRHHISHVKPEMGEGAAKQMLCQLIDTYIQERITFAGEVVVKHALQRGLVAEGDVVLTFARSHVVEKLLLTANAQGKQFRVIVVDSRPLLEGKGLRRRLLRAGLSVTYIQLSAVSYVMKDVTRVFLGAAGFMSNGAVSSRVGTAAVAMMANTYAKPVIFCCETYKFCERVQLDSICHNELADPDQMVHTGLPGQGEPVLSDWRDIAPLKLLNLMYDLTPAKYVSLVVTEVGMTPPTSVPVLIREQAKNLEQSV